MRVLNSFSRFFLRFRYPVSMPEDIAIALGIEISNHMKFEEFISKLTCPSCKPTKLSKFMSRDQAEEAFCKAPRKERFLNDTLISYCFSEKGWVEFNLQFDNNSKLRRIYLKHKDIKQDNGFEIELNKCLG